MPITDNATRSAVDRGLCRAFYVAVPGDDPAEEKPSSLRQAILGIYRHVIYICRDADRLYNSAAYDNLCIVQGCDPGACTPSFEGFKPLFFCALETIHDRNRVGGVASYQLAAERPF